MSLQANTNRNPKRKRPPWQPLDFIPEGIFEPPEPLTESQREAMAKQLIR